MNVDKNGTFEARVKSVIGPDILLVDIYLGFDVVIQKKVKLGGIDSNSVRSLSVEQAENIVRFINERVLGKDVLLKTTRRGDFFYGRVFYGINTASNLLDDLLAEFNNDEVGSLKRFDKPERA